MGDRARQPRVARQRRLTPAFEDLITCDWRGLAQGAVLGIRREDDEPHATTPSHRHSMAVCGAPVDEAALLFGGNVSGSVAGNWVATDELYLARFPDQYWDEWPSFEALQPDGPRPVGRWGASLTRLARGGGHSGECAYLWGGWWSGAEAADMWALHLREAGPEWRPISRRGPLPTAFHTCTPCQDCNLMVVTGGLGGDGSASGLFLFNEEEGWENATQDGPSLAGHCAGHAAGRLVLFGGIERDGSAGLGNDMFRGATHVFDTRAMRWDPDAVRGEELGGNQTSQTPSRSAKRGWYHAGELSPGPRRNAACATIGNRIIVQGGWDDYTMQARRDAWAFDTVRGTWTELFGDEGGPADNGGPGLEAHKAVVSGFDMYTFGGHSGPGEYPSPTMSVNAISFGGTVKAV